MRQRASEEEPSVALYWDFENLHASLCEARQEGAYSRQDNRFRVQEPLIDIQVVIELAMSFGPIAINRAYCNWQYFSRYRDALLQGAVELIQLFPPGGSAKNGADIKLCLDAMEDIDRLGHIGTVVVVSGDSDFMPLSQKVKAAGRVLVGVGARPFTNRHWARSCHDFRYYENLAPSPEGLLAVQPTPQLQADAVELFGRAIRLLADGQGDAWVSEGAMRQMLKRLDSTFDPREYGYANLLTMLEGLDALIEVEVEVMGGAAERQLRLRCS